MTAFAMTYAEPLTTNSAPRVNWQPVVVKTPRPADADSRLVARLCAGDTQAFEQLVKQNHAPMIRMAMRYVADRDVAEEVVQNTWIAVIEGIKGYEGRSTLRSWIFAILINKAKDRGVRESRHVNFSALESADDGSDDAVDPSRFHVAGEHAGDWAMPPQPWNEHTPERLLASKQALEAMSRAIDELPASLRDVLVLKDVEEHDSDYVCKKLNITETNLYVRLHRARERVRAMVEAALLRA
jgi:RNA polymerase sigma-70 factor (ECF subfamily)